MKGYTIAFCCSVFMKSYTIATILAFCNCVIGPLFAHGHDHQNCSTTPTFHVTSKIVTGQSPFPCPPFDPRFPIYPNTQVEPSIAVGRNPIDSRFPMVVIGYQNDRYSRGGGCNADYMIISVDGGKTFGAPIPVPVVRCFGGPFERVSDPHVAISSTGEIYFSTLSFNLLDDLLNSATISKYNVCKKKFIYTRYLNSENRSDFLVNDYDNLFLDPQDKSGKTGYVTWILDFYPTGDFSTGQSILKMSKTSDGVHWSAPFDIYQFPQSVVDQFGGDVSSQGAALTLINNHGKPFSKFVASFFLVVNWNKPIPPYIQKVIPFTTVSADQGKTWSNPIPLDNTLNNVTGQPVDPSNIFAIIRPQAGLNIIEDRDREILYAFSQEHSLAYDGIPTQVILYISTDEAASWTKIGPVNTVLSTQAFIPTSCLIDEGRIALSYYDFRNYSGNPNGSLETDRWLDIYYFDKENNTLTLEAELRLTDESFNYRDALQVKQSVVSPAGFFLGDYMGIQFFERKIYHVFSIVPPNQGPNQSHLQFSVIEQKHPIPGNQ